MPLSAGSRLGPYEIVAPLGAGGMGEVYRAKDTRLGREVAIKVLPAEVANDPERLRRFEQEARAASALNHPNILTVFDVGMNDGAPYLVTELLEGESVRARLAGGALPTRKAIEIGVQVARGLATAHAKGIIHRDLKPENLFVSRDGTVKILDFGLAKLTLPESRALAEATTVAGLTATGVVMGTVGYMAPEQVRGESADARSDLFALGCVIYELLMGRRAFAGATPADTLSAILRDDPPAFARVAPQRQAPQPLESLVLRCLEKDPHERFSSARDLAFALEALAGDSSDAHQPQSAATAVRPVPVPAPERRYLPWLAAALALAATLGIGTALLLRERPPASSEPPEIRFSLHLPDDRLFLPDFALAPDGRTLVVGVAEGFSPDRATPSSSHLFVRPLDDETLRPLPGTEWACCPFFSPDGASIGFYSPTRMRLERVLLDGGSPQRIVDLPEGFDGADWAPDGTILVAVPTRGISKVSADGGSLTPVTTRPRDFEPGEVYHSFPQALPGGRALLFPVTSDTEAGVARMVVLELASGARRNLVEGASFGRYADGLLVFSRREGDLFAAPFDVERRSLKSDPKPTGETVDTQYHAGRFSVTPAGALAYLPHSEMQPGRLLLVDAHGTQSVLPIGVNTFFPQTRISPDGRRLVLGEEQPDRRLSTYDLDGGGRRIVAEGACYWPLWTADGRSIVYNCLSTDTAAVNLYRKAADGSGSAERLTSSHEHQQALAVTPDGYWLIFSERSATTGYDLWLLPLEGERSPRVLLQTSANELQGALSPDGRWFAYASDESGRMEVYLRSFPSGGAAVRVSEDGGGEPVWSRDGRALFFRDNSGRVVWTVSFAGSPRLAVGTPRRFAEGWFTEVLPFGRQIDTTPDGRVLIPVPPLRIQHEFRIVLNWTAALKRRLGIEE